MYLISIITIAWCLKKMKSNNYCTHGIHPYHAKFIPSIPKDFMLQYSKTGQKILDPFCGSGTTLLEALLNGRDAVGVDMNNIAVKISLAKTFIPDIRELDCIFDEIIEDFTTLTEYTTVSFPDKEVWYTKDVSEVIDKLFFLISKIKSNDYRNVFEVLLSSILKTVSNKRSIWNNGYIADNVLPNKKYTGDALKVFRNKYYALKKSYIELVSALPNRVGNVSIQLSNIIDYSPNEQFDLVITSPPYPFAVDFVKYNRLVYYWFGWDVNKKSEEETGSRTKRNRSNAVEDFFNEMELVYKHIFSLVKEGGYFCMTVADTHRNKSKVSFVEWLYRIFCENGWNLVADDIRQLECQSMAQKRIQYEHKLVFKKM